MALLDLLGRRWSLRVMWELQEPAQSFREIQSRCDGMSSSVLSQRLGELADAEIVSAQEGGGYALTGEGRALLELLRPMDSWARRWAERQPR